MELFCCLPLLCGGLIFTGFAFAALLGLIEDVLT